MPKEHQADFGEFKTGDIKFAVSPSQKKARIDAQDCDSEGEEDSPSKKAAAQTEEKKRSRGLEKAFQAWNVDKRHGLVPPEEISQVLSTFRGSELPPCAKLCRDWADLLKCEWEAVVSARPQPGKALAHGVDTAAFVAALCQDVSPPPPPISDSKKSKRQRQAASICPDPAPAPDELGSAECSYGATELTPQSLECHSEGPAQPVANDSLTAAEQILAADSRSSAPVLLRFQLHNFSPQLVKETERRIQLALQSETSAVRRAFTVGSVRCVREPAVPSEGLPRRESKLMLLKVAEHLPFELFEELTHHILHTLDFIYDLSLENRRSRALWELFKEWDTKDHGFIDCADLLKRLGTMRFFLDRGVDVGRVIEQMGLPEDISLTCFRSLMNRLLDSYSEEQVWDVMRALKHQLQGDDDIRDCNYAVNKYLRSEIEKEQKREERMRQLAARRASFSGSVVAAAKHDVARGRIARLEQERRHAFDSIAFDDIASITEAKVMAPGTRLLYEQVATAACLLLDMPPAFVDGRLEHWAALREALRHDMPGMLRQLHELNPGSVSLVRVRKCMSFLYLNESDPSNVLRHSWFLSALCQWSHAVAKLACINNGWEWPPAGMPTTAASREGGSATPGPSSTPSTSGPGSAHRMMATRGGGAAAARALAGSPQAAAVLPRPPTASSASRKPPLSARPRPGTAGTNTSRGGAAVLTARTSRYAKLLDMLGTTNCMVHSAGKTTAAPGSNPVSPFPASDLFVRKRHTGAPGWEAFKDKVQRETELERAQWETAASEAPEEPGDTPQLSERDNAHLWDMLHLNEALGLPPPSHAEFIGGAEEYAPAYWDDVMEEDD